MSFTKTLTNIDSFIQIKERCPFCKRRLSPILTNFESVTVTEGEFDVRYINHIVSELKEDRFKFRLSTHGEYSDVMLDIYDNSITFNGSMSLPQAISIIDMLKMHVELQCLNNYCDMDYYIASMPIDCFVFINDKEYKIRPLRTWMEAFAHNHLWVQNDWDEEVMRIFARNKPDSIPLKYDILDLESMPKQKIINRIQTMVNFS